MMMRTKKANLSSGLNSISCLGIPARGFVIQMSRVAAEQHGVSPCLRFYSLPCPCPICRGASSTRVGLGFRSPARTWHGEQKKTENRFRFVVIIRHTKYLEIAGRERSGFIPLSELRGSSHSHRHARPFISGSFIHS